MPSRPSKRLQTFRNPSPGRDYRVQMTMPEFTCLCPLTGQPDFATLELEYVPDRLCVELKSLKLYVWSFRDEGAFCEQLAGRIADDVVYAIAPRHVTVRVFQHVRGGIAIVAEADRDGPA